jgi:hypothetical protein
MNFFETFKQFLFAVNNFFWRHTMNNSEPDIARRYCRCSHAGERGIAALELAIILPVLLLMAFAIIDFGRLFQYRLVLTNLSREGGSIASRELSLPTGSYSPKNLIEMLKAGSSPLNLNTASQDLYKIYIWKIRAGTSEENPDPYIDNSSDVSASSGSLNVDSSIDNGNTNLGLSEELYNHLVFDAENDAADISEVTVVEIFYKYNAVTPITQIAQAFWNNPLLNDMILSSKAVF